MNKRYINFVLTIVLTIVLLTIANIGNTAIITYTATDLTDTTVGEDLWEYSYAVSDHTFASDTGFTIYFDLGSYDLLDPTPPAPNADWDILTFDPDPFLPDDGIYDAYALVDNASLADPFTVDFVWLGVSTGPSSQFFEVYDGFTFDILESGNCQGRCRIF